MRRKDPKGNATGECGTAFQRRQVLGAGWVFTLCLLAPAASEGAIIGLEIDTEASNIVASGFPEFVLGFPFNTTLRGDDLFEQFPESLSLRPTGDITLNLENLSSSSPTYALSSPNFSGELLVDALGEPIAAQPNDAPAQLAGAAVVLSTVIGRAAIRNAVLSLNGQGNLVSAGPSIFTFSADDVGAEVDMGQIDFDVVQMRSETDGGPITFINDSFDIQGQTSVNDTGDQLARIVGTSPFVLELPVNFNVTTMFTVPGGNISGFPIAEINTTVNLSGVIVANEVVSEQVIPEPSSILIYAGIALCCGVGATWRKRKRLGPGCDARI